jgi:hypothetical protein
MTKSRNAITITIKFTIFTISMLLHRHIGQYIFVDVLMYSYNYNTILKIYNVDASSLLDQYLPIFRVLISQDLGGFLFYFKLFSVSCSWISQRFELQSFVHRNLSHVTLLKISRCHSEIMYVDFLLIHIFYWRLHIYLFWGQFSLSQP